MFREALKALAVVTLCVCAQEGWGAPLVPPWRNVLIVGIGLHDYDEIGEALKKGEAPAIKEITDTGSFVVAKCHQCAPDLAAEWGIILSGVRGGKLTKKKLGGKLVLPPELSFFRRLAGLRPKERYHSFAVTALPTERMEPRPVSAHGENAVAALGKQLATAGKQPFLGFVDLRDPAAASAPRVRETDRLLRAVRGQLERRGLASDTLLFVVSPRAQKMGKGYFFTNLRGLRRQGTFFDLVATLYAEWGGSVRSADPGLRGDDLRLREGEEPLRQAAGEKLKVGYFFGVRTTNFYRALLFGRFEEVGLGVDLFTRYLDDDEFVKLPADRKILDDQRKSRFGKVKGEELLHRMRKGAFDLVTIGETAFLKAVEEGEPIVAVAEIAHDRAKEPGRCLLARKGFSPKSAADWKGKTILAKRSSGGDYAFVLEFFRHEGVPIDSVTIKEDFRDDEMADALVHARADAGLYHLSEARRLIEERGAKVVSRLEWLDMEMSQALLVAPKARLKELAPRIEQVVRGLIRQGVADGKLSRKERLGSHKVKGFQIDDEAIPGMNLPVMEPVPFVRPEKLDEMAALLLRHGMIVKAPELRGFVDNSIVKAAAAKEGK